MLYPLYTEKKDEERAKEGVAIVGGGRGEWEGVRLFQFISDIVQVAIELQAGGYK
jgi:hypothetical protein